MGELNKSRWSLQRLNVENPNGICNSPNCNDDKIAESTEMIDRLDYIQGY